MAHTFHFSRLLHPVKDGIIEVCDGLVVRLSNEVLKEHKPEPIVKVFAPGANFIANPIFLNAWTLKDGDPQLLIETYYDSFEWMDGMGYERTDTIVWPVLCWPYIYAQERDLLFVIQSYDKEFPEGIVLQIEQDTSI